MGENHAPFSKRLEQFSDIGDLYICTAGIQVYADAIAELLDPHKRLFKRHRVKSNRVPSNINNKKYLWMVFQDEIKLYYGKYGKTPTTEDIEREVALMRQDTIICKLHVHNQSPPVQL